MTSPAQYVDIPNVVISLTHKNTVKIRFRIYDPSTTPQQPAFRTLVLSMHTGGPLAFRWVCRRAGEDCGFKMPVANTLTIGAHVLQPNSMYTFELQVTAPAGGCFTKPRSDAATVKIKALPGKPPALGLKVCTDSVHCSAAVGTASVNAGKPCYLKVNISKGDCPVHKLTSKWTLASNASIPTTAIKTPALLRKHQVALPGRFEIFKLEPPITSSTYKFRVVVSCSAVHPATIDFAIRVNVPPQHGVLVVHPDTGSAAQTDFTLSHVRAWYDEQPPLTYARAQSLHYSLEF